MSILGEHPLKISEKNLSYLFDLISEERFSMTKLAALMVIQQIIVNDASGEMKCIFLKNGILEYILMDFDAGYESEQHSVYFDVSLNILWSLSKLFVCTLQPLITDSVIRRLLSVFDMSASFYSYPSKFEPTFKSLCENKHLVGNISLRTTTIKIKEDIINVSKGLLKNLTYFPNEIVMCLLYDTNDPDNEIDIASNLTTNGLAWPLKNLSDSGHCSADDNEADWKDVLVTEMIGGPYFWAHIGIESVENVRKVQNLLLLEYSNNKLETVSCGIGDLVVVAKEKEEDKCFFRAQVIAQGPQKVKVWAMDYGFVFDVVDEDVFKMPESLLDIPQHVQLCCINGIQPKPRDPSLLQLTAAILCNLTFRSFPAGNIIEEQNGFETLQKFIELCPDEKINTEVIKLITNISYTSRSRKAWLDTDIISILLYKLSDPDNTKLLPVLMYCLSNLIARCDEARAKFYHNQGIDAVLKQIIIHQTNGVISKAGIHLLKAFVQRINSSTTEEKPPSAGKQYVNTPKELNKLVNMVSELKQGEIEWSMSQDRLNGQNLSSEEVQHTEMHYRRNELSDPTSVGPVNVCEQIYHSKTYIKDDILGFETDSLHELRPNVTIKNVSASVIATHVCGMLNNRKGGQILFGVSKGSKVIGVAVTRDDRDEFRLGVDKMMTDKLSPSVLHSLFDVEYYPVEEVDELTGQRSKLQDVFIIIIRIKPSKGILYTVKADNSSHIRFGAVTSPLTVQDLRDLVILEEEDNYRSQIIELRHKLQLLDSLTGQRS